MGLFQYQDQHGDNSCDVDRNSASGACGNEDEVHEEQQVQYSGRGVSDGAHEEPQNQNGGLERAEEANCDVTEERMQDERILIEAAMENSQNIIAWRLFLLTLSHTQNQNGSHMKQSQTTSQSFSARNQKMKLLMRILSKTQVFL